MRLFKSVSGIALLASLALACSTTERGGGESGDGASGGGGTQSAGSGSNAGSGPNAGSGGGNAGNTSTAGNTAGAGSAGTDSSGGTGGGGSVSTEPDTDPVGTELTLLFNPMYSAYIPNSNVEFKLPAIAQGVADVQWSTDDPSKVDLTPDPTTGGILITTRGSGTVKIIARAGALSGSADLHITEATQEEWDIGEDRYNNEIPFPMQNIIPDGGFGDGGIRSLLDGGVPDGGFTSIDPGSLGINIPDDLSCVNCHGTTAQALDVEHTPQQTGGYSDDDLISIFTMGMKPPGATFHTPFPEFIYIMYHTWEATPEEQKGLIVYLRSLEPKTQGALDFAGLADNFGIGGGAPGSAP
jgi:hypothetical protein